MRKISFMTVGAVLFLAVTLVTASRSLSAAEIRQSLAQLESNEYAKNVINMIQVEQSKHTTVGEIKLLLLKLKQSLVKSIGFEEASQAIIKSNCDSLINNLHTQIPLYQHAVEDARKRLDQSKVDEREGKTILNETEAQLQQVLERLNKGEQTMAQQLELSSSKVQRIEEAISAIEEAVTIVRSSNLKDKTTGKTFVQLDDAISKIFTIGSEFSLKNLAFYSGQVRSIREEITGDTTELVEVGKNKGKRKLVKLLNELADNFRAALAQEQNLLEESQKAWETVKNDLNNERSTLENAREHIRSRIDRAISERDQLKQTIHDNTNLLAVSQDSLKTEQAECSRVQSFSQGKLVFL